MADLLRAHNAIVDALKVAKGVSITDAMAVAGVEQAVRRVRLGLVADGPMSGRLPRLIPLAFHLQGGPGDGGDAIIMPPASEMFTPAAFEVAGGWYRCLPGYDLSATFDGFDLPSLATAYRVVDVRGVEAARKGGAQ